MAEAIFLNREELPVYPMYYDPVHDFGFLRFDPSKLQFMQVRSMQRDAGILCLLCMIGIGLWHPRGGLVSLGLAVVCVLLCSMHA